MSFTGLLLVAMVAGTIVAIAFGVLSRFLIDDLGLSRARVGGLVTAVAVVAAIASIPAGRLTDSIGGRRALVLMFAFSALALVSVAVAPVYALLLVGAGLGGVAQALANPATNTLIAGFIPAGERGLTTGIKQSGVQVALFVSGLLLPLGAVALGWRATFAMIAVVPLIALVSTRAIVPPDVAASQVADDGPPARLPRAVWWLTIYSALMGVGAGALFTFLPLYAQEEFGMTVGSAGLLVAVFGFIAMVFRIASGPFSERLPGFEGVLGAFAAIAALSALVLQMAPGLGLWALWLGVMIAATSATTWNSVAMLAVMHEADLTLAGRSSGMVVLGFLAGFAVGPVIFGYSVDTTGNYDVGLWGLVVVFVAALVLTAAWRAKRADQSVARP